jgi:hypothetical protein
VVDGEGADAGRYAIELARRGYTALTFDFAGWGDGGGELRHVGSPASKIADIGAAACLSSRSFVAPGGVAHVGICTSGRYALAAVAAGAPIRSFAAVVGWFHDTSTVARSTAAEPASKNGCDGRTRRSSDWWRPEKSSLSRRTRGGTTGPECSSSSTTTPTPHAAPCRRGRTSWPR